MHTIKGGWIGRTFALAQSNDSGGKKSRMRRSKEERKELVVAFIKKYQKLNRGNFPSLNLTHKEVGGSFYTVREIVREVIQENRVLGPSKLTPEEQSPDRFFEQYPLGSIAIEAEMDLSSSEESHIITHILPIEDQDTSKELVSNSSLQLPEPEHRSSDEGKIVNGVETNDEYDKTISTESLDGDIMGLEENVAELEASKAKVTHVAAEMAVEAFLVQDISEKLVLSSSVQCPEPENQRSDEGQIVNGVETNKEYGKAISTESLDGEILEWEENVAELEASKARVTHVAAEMVVEAFHDQDMNEELVLISSVQGPDREHQTLDEGKIVNGSTQAVEKNEELDNKVYPQSRDREILGSEKTVAEPEASKAKLTRVATDLVVETFPVTSRSSITYGLDEKSVEPSNTTGTLGYEESEKVETNTVGNTSVVNGTNYSESSSDLENENGQANVVGPLFKGDCALVDDKPVGNLGAPSLKNPNDFRTIEDPVLDINVGTTEVKEVSYAEIKLQAMNALDNIPARSLDGTVSASPSQHSTYTKAIPSKDNSDLQHGGSSLKESKPTLDRMNLESWETASEKSSKPDANPLFVFFKSFIAAFVKFWSE